MKFKKQKIDKMHSFIKRNDTNNEDTFFKEVEGLKLLEASISKHQNRYINIPKIFNVTSQKLELELIETYTRSEKLSISLAVGLALIHRTFNSENKFGLEYDNYIGLNKQKNILCDSWGEFFYKYRLKYQIELIKDISIKQDFQETLEKNKKQLIKFLDKCKKPSLVHGDLWSGNVLFSKDKVYLIDPAVFYADREVDIAMTRLFGDMYLTDCKDGFKYINRLFDE